MNIITIDFTAAKEPPTLIEYRNHLGQYFIKCSCCNYSELKYKTHIRKYCPNCGERFDRFKRV